MLVGASYSHILWRGTAPSSPPLAVDPVLPELTACPVTCWSACLPAQCGENPGRRRMPWSFPYAESFPSVAPALPTNAFHIITDNRSGYYRLSVLLKGCQLPKSNEAQDTVQLSRAETVWVWEENALLFHQEGLSTFQTQALGGRVRTMNITRAGHGGHSLCCLFSGS